MFTYFKRLYNDGITPKDVIGLLIRALLLLLVVCTILFATVTAIRLYRSLQVAEVADLRARVALLEQRDAASSRQLELARKELALQRREWRLDLASALALQASQLDAALQSSAERMQYAEVSEAPTGYRTIMTATGPMLVVVRKRETIDVGVRFWIEIVNASSVEIHRATLRVEVGPPQPSRPATSEPSVLGKFDVALEQWRKQRLAGSGTVPSIVRPGAGLLVAVDVPGAKLGKLGVIRISFSGPMGVTWEAASNLDQ